MKRLLAISLIALMASLGLLSVASTATAQLAVTVSPVKVTGKKAVVPLALKNNFTEKVESARAAVFLLDERGKMVGQSTRWIIDGGRTNSLQAGGTNAYYFVITGDRPFTTTNLTVKVNFIRVVLEAGKVADVAKEVIVTPVK